MSYLEKRLKDPKFRRAWLCQSAMERFLEQVDAELKRQGRSRKWLAEETRLAEPRVSLIMSGGQNLTAMTMTRIANALGMKLEVRLVPQNKDGVP